MADVVAAYADDYAEWTAGLVYDVILDKFYELIQPFAQHVPYMMSPGNHVCCPHAVRLTALTCTTGGHL